MDRLQTGCSRIWEDQRVRRTISPPAAGGEESIDPPLTILRNLSRSLSIEDPRSGDLRQIYIRLSLHPLSADPVHREPHRLSVGRVSSPSDPLDRSIITNHHIGSHTPRIDDPGGLIVFLYPKSQLPKVPGFWI